MKPTEIFTHPAKDFANNQRKQREINNHWHRERQLLSDMMLDIERFAKGKGFALTWILRRG